MQTRQRGRQFKNCPMRERHVHFRRKFGSFTCQSKVRIKCSPSKGQHYFYPLEQFQFSLEEGQTAPYFPWGRFVLRRRPTDKGRDVTISQLQAVIPVE